MKEVPGSSPLDEQTAEWYRNRFGDDFAGVRAVQWQPQLASRAERRMRKFKPKTYALRLAQQNGENRRTR